MPPASGRVIVVGAGPVGLTAAIGLAAAGLQVTIVDQLAAGLNGSRAATLHAHTLEQLEPLGLTKKLVEMGIEGHRWQMFDGSTLIFELDLNTYLKDKTEYPYILFLPQHTTESLLRDKLSSYGVQVQWNRKVLTMESEGDGVRVGFENGTTEFAHYVIGADGNRSVVRSLSKIDFKHPITGQPYDTPPGQIPPPNPYIIVTDICVREPVPKSFARDAFSFHAGAHGSFFTAPLRVPPIDPKDAIDTNAVGVSYWRVGIWRLASEEKPPRELGLEDIRAEIAARKAIDVPFEIVKVFTASRYRVRLAVADTLYTRLGKGHILLAGDSCHVHSPAGGQGMNLGICDALALSKAIVDHIKSDAKDDDILCGYAKERSEVIHRVVGMTNRLMSVITGATVRPELIPALRWILRTVVNRLGFIKEQLSYSVAGLNNQA